MRTILTALVLILYVGLFNFYLYELPRDFLSLKECKLLYNYLTLGMIVFYLLDKSSGFDNWLHKELNKICIFCVLINYVLIILTHHTVLKNEMTELIAFNAAIFVTTLMILISAIRHHEIT